MNVMLFFTYDKANHFATLYALENDFRYLVPGSHFDRRLNRHATWFAGGIWQSFNGNRAFDWDGFNFYLADGSEQLIIHEIAHHIVAKRKRGIRRLRVPEFGLGASPTTKSKDIAKYLMLVNMQRSRYEEAQASLYACFLAKHLGLDFEIHRAFTTTNLAKTKQHRRSLTRLGLLDKDGYPTILDEYADALKLKPRDEEKARQSKIGKLSSTEEEWLNKL